MGFFNKYRKLVSVVDGECKPLSQMSDEVFSSEMLGKGFMVSPKSNYFYAPCDCKIENIAESKHAYSILTEDGIDILIHIGVDTVSLKGDGFDSQVVEGQNIKSGDLIAIADLDLIKKNGFETDLKQNGGYLLSYFGTGEKSLGIFAHADVVPVSDDWLFTKPFEPMEKGGCIIGRGALDDKSAVVLSLYCAKILKELNIGNYTKYLKQMNFSTFI